MAHTLVVLPTGDWCDLDGDDKVMFYALNDKQWKKFLLVVDGIEHSLDLDGEVVGSYSRAGLWNPEVNWIVEDDI